MQYLYVLSSTKKDLYYEQFLLSITSLKLYTPNADIVLLCDLKTKENLTGVRSNHERLINKTIVVEAPINMLQIDISRYLKTSMRRHLSGDILFIDCDTIISDDLSSFDKSNIILGACLDKHSLIDRHSKSKEIIKNEKKMGFTSYLSNKHYNSGVIYCSDTPEAFRFFERWHELWLACKNKNITRDQTSFNMTIHEYESHFTELDGIWNCQLAFNGLQYIANSKIIHNFASESELIASPFIFDSEELFYQIKETGVISDEIMELLKKPKEAFVKELRIIAGDNALYVISSNLFEMILWLKSNIPFIFNILNRFSYINKKIAKFFMIKTSRRKDGGIKYYN